MKRNRKLEEVMTCIPRGQIIREVSYEKESRCRPRGQKTKAISFSNTRKLKKSSLHVWLNDESVFTKNKVIQQLPQVEELVRSSLYHDYMELLDEISKRILTHYNE